MAVEAKLLNYPWYRPKRAQSMKPTCKAESMEMPPRLREEKAWEKRALRETTGLLSFYLISIKSKMYPNKSMVPDG
jgi:hypothetical protein